MAKRRTRKEKQTAKHSYVLGYSLTDTVTEKGTVAGQEDGQLAMVTTNQIVNLHTDTLLIKKDLIKSVVISCLILLIEFGIYRYWYK